MNFLKCTDHRKKERYICTRMFVKREITEHKQKVLSIRCVIGQSTDRYVKITGIRSNSKKASSLYRYMKENYYAPLFQCDEVVLYGYISKSFNNPFSAFYTSYTIPFNSYHD